MNIGEATIQLFQSLKPIYGESEASQITDWVMERLTGLSKSERLIKKETGIDDSQFSILHSRLMAHTPVQYVLSEAWFCGMKFYVDENVLIPRPETEELVDWIAKTIVHDSGFIDLLDIGTGSGCIPIAIKKKIHTARITAIDVSAKALEAAQKNADALQASVNFIQLDFLDENNWQWLGQFDIIASNPPYITIAEKDQMRKNVLDHEPHLALFAEKDALIFYKKIASFGKTHLKENGSIFVEINETLGRETIAVFEQAGYKEIELKQDQQGKDRMIKASKSQ